MTISFVCAASDEHASNNLQGNAHTVRARDNVSLRFMRYTYYLRPLNSVSMGLDESLSRRLTSRSSYESLQTENEHASQSNDSHD